MRNEKGMTLIEVMVTSAVGLLVVMAMGNAMIGLYKQQSDVTRKDVANDYAASLSRFLQSEASCTAGLRGQVLRANSVDQNVIIQDFLIHKRQDAQALGAHLDDLMVFRQGVMNPADNPLRDDRLIVEALTISNSNLPDQTIVVGNQTQIRRMAEIKLSLGVIEPGDHIRALKPRVFMVPVTVDSADRIVSCNTELQMEDACTAIGTNLVNGQCVPTENCYMRGTYSRTVCSPGSRLCPQNIINQFTGSARCPSGASAYESGRNSSVFQEDCGKKCSRDIRVNTTYYICMRCS